MKFLILITIAIMSFNVFSAELGEDQKGECKYASQTAKREAKPQVIAEESKVAPKQVNISK